MMKRFSILLTMLALAFSSCVKTSTDENVSLVDFVNPLMGTHSTGALSTGNTYPAIARPWGMNFWMPQTGNMGNGWAYQYTATHIRGFKQTHQPSPWMNDYGQFSIMPMTSQTGVPMVDEADRGSWFSHKAEIANPHYYRVYLADYDIVTELTPTDRAAMFRFTFPETDNSYVLVDAFDRGSYIKVIPEENKIIGYTTRNSGGVPENFKNYFVITFDKPFEYQKTFTKDAPPPVVRTPGQQPQRNAQNMQRPVPEKLSAEKLSDNLEQENYHTGAIIGFKTKSGEVVHAKVASSFISFEQAERNLKELGNDTFDKIANDGKKVWNDVLGRIKVEGGTLDQTRTFYSCLYRALLFPRRFYEYDANNNIVHYSPFNGEVLPGYLYTDSGFWDTFRALFPLLNMAYADENIKMQEGLINTYKESGFFPEWASPGHRSIMVGNNSASVLADAFLKGYKVEDKEALWAGLVHGTQNVHPRSSATGRLGHEFYNTLGYIPYDTVTLGERTTRIRENAARTLEYAYDDWCIYQIGKALGKPESEIAVYAQRAMNYKNLFDQETKLMRGKNADGTFQSPFSPLKWGDAFTEGNSWHYTWSVFHDPQGLIDLMGGDKEFTHMLDSVFSVPPRFDESYYGGVIHEIREMQIMNMGNYAHGNQPIQHMIYMYNYAKEPWKAQYWVRETMDRMYTPWADGYCGDEDNGQTSAWYVFSALGFYPVCPGMDQYVLGAPLFKKATITMDNGKKFVIEAPANSSSNKYIQSMTVNGKAWDKNYINYETLRRGGRMKVDMGPEPNMKRGVTDADRPYSFSVNEKAVQ